MRSGFRAKRRARFNEILNSAHNICRKNTQNKVTARPVSLKERRDAATIPPVRSCRLSVVIETESITQKATDTFCNHGWQQGLARRSVREMVRDTATQSHPMDQVAINGFVVRIRKHVQELAVVRPGRGDAALERETSRSMMRHPDAIRQPDSSGSTGPGIGRS